MATFIEEKKKQKRLVYVLIALLIIAVFILGFVFWQQIGIGQKPQKAASQFEKIVELDMSLLESPVLQELQLFEGIEEFQGKVGRGNPFAPF